MTAVIDVWNVNTYDANLLAELNCESELICQYVRQDKENYRIRQLERHRGPPLENPYAYAYSQFAERVLTPMMNDRIIRGWHYTRLQDEEVDIVRRDGIYVSSKATIKPRLDKLAAAGVLSAEQAEAIYARSPFHDIEQSEARSAMFWMIASPAHVDNSRVSPLLESWGGEGVYFWQREQQLKDKLKSIGKPRVIEVAVPLRITRHAYGAAKAVLAHFGRSIGCEPDGRDFDFYATQPLGPEAVLNILSEGEPNFVALGAGYPVGFATDDEDKTG